MGRGHRPEGLGLRPPAALLQAGGDLPVLRRQRLPRQRGPHVLTRRRGDNPLFDNFFAAAQQAGYRLTRTSTGPARRASRPSSGSSTGKRRSSSQAYLRPAQGRKTWRSRRGPRRPSRLRRNKAIGVVYRGTTGTDYHVGGGRSCWPAARSTPRSCCSCRAWATPTSSPAGHRARAPPARRRGEPRRPPRGPDPARLHRADLHDRHEEQAELAGHGAQVAGGRGEATSNMFEAAGLVRSHEDRAFPDMNLVFAAVAMAFDPDKRSRGTATSCTSARWPPPPGAREDRLGGPDRAPADPDELPVHRARPRRLGQGDAAGPRAARAAGFRRDRRRRGRARPAVRDRRAAARLGGRKGQTGLHPCGTCRMGHGENESSTRARWACTAWRGSGWWTRRSSRRAPTPRPMPRS